MADVLLSVLFPACGVWTVFVASANIVNRKEGPSGFSVGRVGEIKRGNKSCHERPLKGSGPNGTVGVY